MRPVIVIPAYQPEPILLELVKSLQSFLPNQEMIIVNDGSSQEKEYIFKQLSELPHIHLLRHATNLGKGQALKTAFNYYLLHFPANHPGVVTADADGQHAVQDIIHLTNCLTENSEALWLGVRNFDRDVPLRSRFGNLLTARVFKFLVGSEVHDTQTGLRGLPHVFLRDIMKIPATGYEFELDVLISAATHHIPIREISIETVYIDNNKSSHFNPLIDSIKIYWVFIRFAALSMTSAGLDILMFFISYFMTESILLGTVIARVISGSFNFVFCKTLIFQSPGHFYLEALKYLLIAFVIMMASYFSVVGMVNYLGMNVYVSKIIADVGIFLTNFLLQNIFVFRTNPKLSEAIK